MTLAANLAAWFGLALFILLVGQVAYAFWRDHHKSRYMLDGARDNFDDVTSCVISVGMGVAALVGLMLFGVTLGLLKPPVWQIWTSGIALIPLVYAGYHLAIRTILYCPTQGVGVDMGKNYVCPPTDWGTVILWTLVYWLLSFITMGVSAYVFLSWGRRLARIKEELSA